MAALHEGEKKLIPALVFSFYSNQPPSVALRSGATRELVALRLDRVCSVLFMPIHLQIRIDNFFGIGVAEGSPKDRVE